MREVLMVDDTGKTLWRFGSLTEAAYTIGISPTSVNLRIKRESVVNGVRLVYGGGQGDDGGGEDCPTEYAGQQELCEAGACDEG